ncbi:endonuclease domain-containing protein [Aestuariimicrobium ganziense]|uniref:endonuclease domain-containing protein n=1 Tax=Aestuariimicrobium ganziense TaxID=2773677 RepID=UPI0019446332|nr:DUF559 domain-containing protein [Aestuariimicrobium ganziense]
MGTRDDIEHHLSQNGLIRIADHAGWARMLSRLAAQGLVVRYLPGIYIAAASAGDLAIRCAAIMTWDPDAVITGRAAAKLSFWPEAKVTQIEVHSVRKKHAPPGIRLHRSPVPVDEIVESEGLRLASASWVCVHLAPHDLGDAIDTCLRQGRATVELITEAMARAKGRHGNRVRRPIVKASRTNPWSQGERRLHRLMIDRSVTGWLANHGVKVQETDYFLDVAFVDWRIAVEFDGWETHGTREAFTTDRTRQNDLVVEGGWTIIRVTWEMLDDPERVIDWIRSALRRAAGKRRARKTAALVSGRSR